MIQTVIFDMDGVIVDTEPVHHFAYNQHLTLKLRLKYMRRLLEILPRIFLKS